MPKYCFNCKSTLDNNEFIDLYYYKNEYQKCIECLKKFYPEDNLVNYEILNTSEIFEKLSEEGYKFTDILISKVYKRSDFFANLKLRKDISFETLFFFLRKILGMYERFYEPFDSIFEMIIHFQNNFNKKEIMLLLRLFFSKSYYYCGKYYILSEDLNISTEERNNIILKNNLCRFRDCNVDFNGSRKSHFINHKFSREFLIEFIKLYEIHYTEKIELIKKNIDIFGKLDLIILLEICYNYKFTYSTNSAELINLFFEKFSYEKNDLNIFLEEYRLIDYKKLIRKFLSQFEYNNKEIFDLCFYYNYDLPLGKELANFSIEELDKLNSLGYRHETLINNEIYKNYLSNIPKNVLAIINSDKSKLEKSFMPDLKEHSFNIIKMIDYIGLESYNPKIIDKLSCKEIIKCLPKEIIEQFLFKSHLDKKINNIDDLNLFLEYFKDNNYNKFKIILGSKIKPFIDLIKITPLFKDEIFPYTSEISAHIFKLEILNIIDFKTLSVEEIKEILNIFDLISHKFYIINLIYTKCPEKYDLLLSLSKDITHVNSKEALVLVYNSVFKYEHIYDALDDDFLIQSLDGRGCKMGYVKYHPLKNTISLNYAVSYSDRDFSCKLAEKLKPKFNITKINFFV